MSASKTRCSDAPALVDVAVHDSLPNDTWGEASSSESVGVIVCVNNGCGAFFLRFEKRRVCLIVGDVRKGRDAPKILYTKRISAILSHKSQQFLTF